MTFTDEVLDALALNSLSGLGPAALRELLSAYGSASALINDAPSAWKEKTSCQFDATAAEADLGPAKARARADAEMAERFGARIYLAHAGPYPDLLAQIACPPPVLYAVGEDIAPERRAIAVVGSRACTHYGEKVARRFAEDFAALGVVTVSGLARGIDTKAHQAALNAGGATWAVVGCGLLMTYPPENRSLAEAIIARGAVVSEFPMATKPHPSNFPRRNRIIAGLSSATVVVEGGQTSGALITARLAAEEGRDVFAVPGPVTSNQSRAPHRLLRDGAILAESAGDVLEELGWSDGILFSDGPASPIAEGWAGKIVQAVGDVPLERDELLTRVKLDAKTAATLLVQLEMQGLIRALPGGKIVRA